MDKESIKNQVNDLMDQRLSRRQSKSTLDACVADQSALLAWRDYHLIGDVIRGDVSNTGDCLIGKISDALDKEPTILAPLRSAPGNTPDSPSVTSLSALANTDSPTLKSDAVKSAGMFAIAASVALFAVLTFSPNPVTTANNNAQVVAATSDVPTLDNESTASFEAEFGQMLVEHGEFTATSAMNGLASYAKLVSNDSLGQ